MRLREDYGVGSQLRRRVFVISHIGNSILIQTIVLGTYSTPALYLYDYLSPSLPLNSMTISSFQSNLLESTFCYYCQLNLAFILAQSLSKSPFSSLHILPATFLSSRYHSQYISQFSYKIWKTMDSDRNYNSGRGNGGGRGRGRGRGGGGGRGSYQDQGGRGRGNGQNQFAAPQRGTHHNRPPQQQWVNRPPAQSNQAPPPQNPAPQQPRPQAWGNRPPQTSAPQQPPQMGVGPSGGRSGQWTGRPWVPSPSTPPFHPPLQTSAPPQMGVGPSGERSGQWAGRPRGPSPSTPPVQTLPPPPSAGMCMFP